MISLRIRFNCCMEKQHKINESFAFSENPLVLYVFSKNKGMRDLFVEQTCSGAVCVNDTLMHFTGESCRNNGASRDNFIVMYIVMYCALSFCCFLCLYMLLYVS